MKGDFTYMPQASKDRGIHIEEKRFIISADLGQANDYTAISVLEHIVKGRGVLGAPADNVYSFDDGMEKAGIQMYHLRHLERMPRGTEYPAVVDRLIEMYNSEPLKGQRKAVVIDYTGVGRPVYDLMRKSGFRRSLNAISITGGNTVHRQAGIANTPKRDLITNLQVLLQNEDLKIAKGIKEADALVEELANFQVKISAGGHDTYGGRSGVHDDLVLSVAMAAWLATQVRCNTGNDEYM